MIVLLSFIWCMDVLVLLVGHSCGDAVITETGNSEKVVGLIYIAAPDAGKNSR
ncbi:hypothetical protein ACM55H_15510 [Flavobacterium sp. ZT3R17]|uniref:hypothetical protein n=1 Tax=Flavobacterium cryoconiti TaxID=3398736 RepID=UPI003A887703